MSGGSNGLPAVANLSDRQKCPTSPTKRKWCDGDLAKEEADRRTRSLNKRGIAIEAYLCPDCGCYHLTKSTGGDSLTLQDGKLTVGEFQALAPNHPVFATAEDPEPPIVPGDHETRVKFARAYLDARPGAEPTTDEMCEAIGGCTKDSLRKVMRELGYYNTRGRSARWVFGNYTDEPRKSAAELLREKRESEGLEIHEASEEEVDNRIELDLSYDNDQPDYFDGAGHPLTYEWTGAPQGSESQAQNWIDLNTDRVRHMAIGDLIDAYAAAGLSIRIQVEV